MKNLLVLAVLLVGCRDGRLVQVCGQTCAPEGYGTGQLSRGECRVGHWDCFPDGGGACVGYKLPTTEICDGLDNDCDGEADHLFAKCTSGCGTGLTVCENGKWTECNAPKPQPEVCDGKDNDCNGLIDDGVDQNVQFCYPGKESELASPNSACHPGFLKCINGVETCTNYQGPVKEICDGKDDDCNGRIDDIDGGFRAVDVVIVFDCSGSMTPYITSLQQAAATWSATYRNQPEKRFALVTAPDPNYNISTPQLYQQFSTPDDLELALLKMAASGISYEPTIDALTELADPSNPLALDWAPGARRKIIVFSDEEPQSYAHGGGSNFGSAGVAQAADAGLLLAGAQEQTFVFTDFTWASVPQEWIGISQETSGAMFDIQASVPNLISQLDTIIQSDCLPDGGVAP